MTTLAVVLARQNDMAKCLNCDFWASADPARIKGRCTAHDMVTLDLMVCSKWERAKNPPIEVKMGATSG